MNKAQVILYLHPNADPLNDFSVQDDSDGKGQFIAQWNVKDATGAVIPKPTDAELQKAWEEMNSPDRLLQQAKEVKIEELNSRCNETILAGFTSSALGVANKYDFDYEAQTNLNGQLNFINAGLIASNAIIKWKASGVPQDHTVEQFKTVCVDGFAFKQDNVNKYWTLKAQVQSATTKTEVDAVVW